MLPRVPSLRRQPTAPNTSADYIHKNFQGFDASRKIIGLIDAVRRSDRQDGPQAKGNGYYAPALREAFVILGENLQSTDISAKTKLVILVEAIPVMVRLKSGPFTEEIKWLHSIVVYQSRLPGPIIPEAAAMAVRTIETSRRLQPNLAMLPRTQQVSSPVLVHS